MLHGGSFAAAGMGDALMVEKGTGAEQKKMVYWRKRGETKGDKVRRRTRTSGHRGSAVRGCVIKVCGTASTQACAESPSLLLFC